MYIVGAAVLVAGPSYLFMSKNLTRPILAQEFSAPAPTSEVDWQLMLGAACFGVGWGLTG